MEQILVTGGTGYLGSWCIATLLEQGYAVRTTVRSLGKADAVRAAVATVTDPGDRLTVVAADLTSDDGWSDAMTDIDAVLHVASPLGGDGREDDDAIIRPAVEGTVRVLQAAADAGVRRVVVTSSGAAATPAPKGDVVIDDTLWTDPDQPGLTAYRKSKVLAEKAAWDFAGTHPALEVTTVLPGAIFGPALPGVSRSSVEIIDRMVSGELPAVPKVEMAVVDVRDLADLHVRAMAAPEAAGQRFLAMGEVLSMVDIGRILRTLGPVGAKAPTRTVPDLVTRTMARFRPELGPLVPMLGRRIQASSRRAHDVLGWQTRPARDTIADSVA